MASRHFRAFLLYFGIALCVFPVNTKSVGKQRIKRSDDTAPLQVVVDNLVQKVNTLQAQLTAEQAARETKEAAFENKLNTYGTVVAFHASSTSTITATPHGTVIVPHVATNIGNANNPQTGFFTAPVSGLYMFHATFMDQDRSGQTDVGIFVGGHLVVASISDSRHGAYDNPGLAAIVHVNAGQTADLRNLIDAVGTFFGSQYTTFSGFLIRAD